ncbi:hypothetical protein KB206_11765 [Microvirga sp. STS02]|uniref:hypothetical protein n=1 Tax=Hymenobacter negativus TaxID=2795026 RepID=UPI0018DB4D17|nr:MULTISPECIES: hypothetical protein [Bacteria]MBH8569564.1 hypothetical protein [Hymenobacter negativus]MBR7209300.1 hypothetical protein [Microvirga sp. STS02]
MKRYAPLLPLALLLSCASTDRPVVETPTVSTVPAVQRAFDVPALLGMNADQIARPLISQSIRPDHDRTPRESSAGATEALYTYWRDTTALEVSYDPSTLHVNSYFIKTKSGLTSDYTTLLKLANVSKYDKRLSIEPIASVSNPNLYTGVKLTPAAPTPVN